MQRIYLDNAATTPVCEEVVQLMADTLRDVFGNPSSIHSEGRKARTVIEHARKTVANYLKCSISEIFFTSGGTESNNTALRCSVRDLGVTRIISSKIEHHCILHTLESLEKEHGIKVEYVGLQPTGETDYDHLNSLLSANGEKTLVSIMHSNNEIGVINNIQKIADLCEKHNAYFHTDTVQTIGYRPFDLTKTKINFLSGSAHKFYGPKGVGFLYINGNEKINPLMEGGSQERNMRAGTENIYGIAGLAKALELADTEMEERISKIAGLKQHFINQVKGIDGLSFNGLDSHEQMEKVLSINFPKSDKSELLLMHLDMAGISASGGSACSSGSDIGSHVMQAISNKPLGKTIRFSFSHKNNIEEINFVVDKLKELYPSSIQKKEKETI